MQGEDGRRSREVKCAARQAACQPARRLTLAIWQLVVGDGGENKQSSACLRRHQPATPVNHAA